MATDDDGICIVSDSLVDVFDQLCFSFGDDDAIRIVQNNDNDNHQDLGYLELQEYSKALAYQLYWRFRPTYVLVDCQGWPGAEVVAILACLRLQVPFVPVSCHNQHAARGRLGRIVEQLQQPKCGIANNKGGDSSKNNPTTTKGAAVSIVALTCCANDQDPVLGVFQQANVHSILFLDASGNLQEPLDVPSRLPASIPPNDNMYVLFTSGTSGMYPKAVVGSHRSTFERIRWFQESMIPMASVAKRTPLTFVDAIAELLGTLLTRESVLVALAPTYQVVDIGRLVAKTRCCQISLLPSQLSQLLHYRAIAPNSLRSLQRIIISGEPCREELWKSFREAFYDQEKNRYSCQLINLYGQTETTGDCCGAVLTDLAKDVVVVNHTVTIGKPLRESICIRAPTGGCPGTGDVGAGLQELIVSGSSCFATGYMGHASSTTTTTTGFVIEDDKVLSFATGDMGFCREGYWYVQGRKDDVAKVNGVWTAPTEVETTFLDYYRGQVCGANKGDAAAAVIIDNRVHVLIEVSSNETGMLRFSRQHMKEQTKLPWNLLPHRVHPCKTLPRTPGTGKIDRAQVKSILQDRVQQISNLEKGHQNGAGTDKQKPQGCSADSLLVLFRSIAASVLIPSLKNGEPGPGGQPEGGTAVDLDMSKSFVELGGDSALAIALHYQLRLHWGPQFLQRCSEKGAAPDTGEDPLAALPPSDLLNSEQLVNVYDALCTRPPETERGPEGSCKKVKRQKDGPKKSFKELFVPEPATVWISSHISVAFAACVDISPLVIFPYQGTSHSEEAALCGVVAACQNGVVQRLRCLRAGVDEQEDASECILVVGSHHLNGWRISYDVLYQRGLSSSAASSSSSTEDSIIVCAVRHPIQDPTRTPGAKVVAMSSDLTSIQWTHSFAPNCTISSPPVLCDETVWVLVSEDKKSSDELDPDDGFEPEGNKEYQIRILSTRDGTCCTGACPIQLPVRVVAKPILLSDCRWKRDDGTSASKIVVYGSCGWETGLLLVDVDQRVLLSTNSSDAGDTENTHRFFSDMIGPIHKNVSAWNEHSFLVTDSWGSLHRVNLKTMKCTSIKLSNKALSAPSIVSLPPQRRIVVGSYDGIVRCVNEDLTATLWTLNAKSIVYAKPLALSDRQTVVVCTTAGDVVQVDASIGCELWRYRIPVGAEIWSDPVELQAVSKDQKCESDTKVRIAFGARDSRLHIIDVPLLRK